MVTAMTSQLESLPNEILDEIFSCFPTLSLLPLLTVSHSIHDLVLRVLHHRILNTWPLPSHGLILEAYHPSGRWTEPYLFCSYLGNMGGLSRSVAYEQSYVDCSDDAERCAKLRDIYSRFRPHRRGDESMRRRPFMGDLANDETTESERQSAEDAMASMRDEKVEHIVNLDSHELFSQLCVSSSLVKLGPVTGVFPSVVEAAGGVIRVWRAWLKEQAAATKKAEEDGVLDLKEVEGDKRDRNILWVDWRKDVGLRVKVREMTWMGGGQAPILEEVDDPEDQPVSYAVEVQELVIRTSMLTLAIERSVQEQHTTSVHIFQYTVINPETQNPVTTESDVDLAKSEKYELDTSGTAIAAALVTGKPIYREIAA